MITTKNNEHKKLNFSSEREQSQACLNSAEHEKNQGRKVLNVPNSTDRGNVIRNVPHLRFPEFEGEWEKSTLDKVCVFHNGRAYKQNELLQSGKYRVLRVGNFFTNDSWYYSNLELEEEKIAVRGDLLYAWSASFGPRFWHEEKVIYHYHIWKVDSFQNVTKSYLYYYLEKDATKIKNEVQGGTMVHITKGDMGKRAITYPCIEEQKKITKLLSILDERIATQNKIIEDLKMLKSAIIDYAINSLDSGFVKFGSLYEMAGEGGTPTTSNASFYDNGKIPFIKIDDLKQKYLTENKDFITELGLQKSSAWLVPTHSILFSNGATIGEISITTYPVCTKQGILGIVPKQNIDVEFLYYFMSSSYFKKAVSRIVTEGTMKTAYLKDINNILCPIPTKEKQQEIAKMPSALNSKIDFEQCILKLFCSQKQYLLRQMFI